MFRIKDPEKSLKFYQEVIGMTLIRTADVPAGKFTNFFLAYTGSDGIPATTAGREGILELCWNYGTEKEHDFKYHK
jgi:lactoylglutathione lyase